MLFDSEAYENIFGGYAENSRGNRREILAPTKHIIATTIVRYTTSPGDIVACRVSGFTRVKSFEDFK